MSNADFDPKFPIPVTLIGEPQVPTASAHFGGSW
jgi:hypothetical protein